MGKTAKFYFEKKIFFPILVLVTEKFYDMSTTYYKEPMCRGVSTRLQSTTSTCVQIRTIWGLTIWGLLKTGNPKSVQGGSTDVPSRHSPCRGTEKS